MPGGWPGDAARIAAVSRRLGMAAPTVTRLVGGSRNRCYRLAGGGLEVVARIAGEHDRAYAVARDAEALAQRLAAEHGLAPRILFEDRDAGVSVMESIPGPPWSRTRAESPAGAARAGEWLARLHAVPVPPGLRRVDFLESLEGYSRQLAAGGAGIRLLDEARRRAARLPRPARAAFCHNDLHHLNMLDSAAGLCVVDWEYAGTGNPLLDVAGYVAYHDLGPGALGHLLAAYAGDGVPPAAGATEDARWLFEAVWWAWLELKRSLDSVEPDDSRDARRRLETRLGLHPA